MATNGTGGSGGSIYGESVSLDDYSLGFAFQSYTKETSEKKLQPQTGQPAGTGGFLPICTTNQGIPAAAQTQPWPHGQPAGTGGLPIWWTNQGIQAAAQAQPWPPGQPAGTGGLLPIWETNQGVQAAAQTRPWPQQQITDTNGFSLELWTKQGCQASAATQLLTQPATSGMLTHGSSARNEEEWRARKRENDRTYRRRKKAKMQNLQNTVDGMGEFDGELRSRVEALESKLCSKVEALEAELRSKVEALEAEFRRLKECVLEMAQCVNKFCKSELKELIDKISTSREFEEGSAFPKYQTPSSSELRVQVQEEVLPQARRISMNRFNEKRKQRERNAAPCDLGKTKKYPKCNN